MYDEQILALVDIFSVLNVEEKERVVSILKPFVNGDISVEETYAMLLEEGFVNQRKVRGPIKPDSPVEKTKEYIKNNIPELSKV